jgi:hypothetical protein
MKKLLSKLTSNKPETPVRNEVYKPGTGWTDNNSRFEAEKLQVRKEQTIMQKMMEDN